MVEKINDRFDDIYINVNEENYFINSEKQFESACKEHLKHFLIEGNNNIGVYKFKLRLPSQFKKTEPDLFAISNDYKYFAIIAN